MIEGVSTDPHTASVDWYMDRYEAATVSRNRWLVTAVAAIGLAFVQALALLCLLPLKTSVPFLIREEVSGAITTVAPLAGNRIVTYEESTRKYFLARYVLARESYDPASLAQDCRTVELMSDPEQRREFKNAILETNPQSPIRVYGEKAKRVVRIKSISLLNDALAQVRLSATVKDKAGTERMSDWVALVGFKFGPAPSLEADRFVNPLGFIVTSYRLDQEVIP